jgi:L-amino acid N-acyltransferase
MREPRAATEADLPATLAIYNDVVRTSTAIFTEAERSPSEHRAWWRERVAAGLPVLVAVQDDEVVGFASYGPFRPWPGYRHTVEHSIYVRADRRRGGHGGRLLAALVDHARAAGVHVVVAGVDGANAASIALHRAHGFTEAGRLHEVAVKHGAWLDLVLLERRLEPA